MHKRVSGNICPLVSWLQLLFPYPNCLRAIGIKGSFRNGEVSVSCRAVGEKRRLFNGVRSRVTATPSTFDNLYGKWLLKLLCIHCTVLLCCQVCSGYWVHFIAHLLLLQAGWAGNPYVGILAGMPASFVGITLSLFSLHSWHLWLSLGSSQGIKQKPERIRL